MNLSKKRIILSKTNKMGDVLIALPTASLLKKVAPDCHIIMLVSEYTKMLPKHCPAVDEYIAWDDPAVKQDLVTALKKCNADIIIHLRGRKKIAQAAKAAGIPLRIGATNRLYNWLYCNKLCRVNRKKNAPFHDTQLDIQHILPLINHNLPDREEIANLIQFEPEQTPENIKTYLDPNKFNIILHPNCDTQAGKREWSLESFAAVIKALDKDQFQIFITGTEADGNKIRSAVCTPYPQVTDMTGKLDLNGLMQFIQSADGLVAGSTGPLHMAASLGIHALGLYTPAPGHEAKRWGPIGKKAEYLVTDKPGCRACLKNGNCVCIDEITPEQVVTRIQAWQMASGPKTSPQT